MSEELTLETATRKLQELQSISSEDIPVRIAVAHPDNPAMTIYSVPGDIVIGYSRDSSEEQFKQVIIMIDREIGKKAQEERPDQLQGIISESTLEKIHQAEEATHSEERVYRSTDEDAHLLSVAVNGRIIDNWLKADPNKGYVTSDEGEIIKGTVTVFRSEYI